MRLSDIPDRGASEKSQVMIQRKKQGDFPETPSVIQDRIGVAKPSA